MHYIVYSRIFEELNCPTVSLLAPSLKAPRLLPRTDSTAPNLQIRLEGRERDGLNLEGVEWKRQVIEPPDYGFLDEESGVADDDPADDESDEDESDAASRAHRSSNRHPVASPP
ncbi:hypothetical protein JCM10049v2_005268 [Rhodotorula toruloides]